MAMPQYWTINDNLKLSGLWLKEPCFLKRTKEPQMIPSCPGQRTEFANSLQAESSPQLYFVWLQRAEKLFNSCQHLTIRFQFHIKIWISAFSWKTGDLEKLGLGTLTAKGAEVEERLLPLIGARSPFIWGAQMVLCSLPFITVFELLFQTVVSFIPSPLYACFVWVM